MEARMSLFEKLRLLSEWSPLFGQIQIVMAAQDPHTQALAVVDALQFAAGKTPTDVDDELLEHIEAVLRTDEGAKLFGWVVEKVKAAAGGDEPEVAA